jgi:hypothetical protein
VCTLSGLPRALLDCELRSLVSAHTLCAFERRPIHTNDNFTLCAPPPTGDDDDSPSSRNVLQSCACFDNTNTHTHTDTCYESNANSSPCWPARRHRFLNLSSISKPETRIESDIWLTNRPTCLSFSFANGFRPNQPNQNPNRGMQVWFIRNETNRFHLLDTDARCAINRILC